MRNSQAHVGQFVKVECPDKDWYSATMTPYVGRTLTIERIGPGPSIHERYAYCKETGEVPFNLGWLQATESKPEEGWISKTLNGRRRRLVTPGQREFGAVTQAVNSPEKGHFTYPFSQVHDEVEYDFNSSLDLLTKMLCGYFSTTDRELRRKVCESYLADTKVTIHKATAKPAGEGKLEFTVNYSLKDVATEALGTGMTTYDDVRKTIEDAKAKGIITGKPVVVTTQLQKTWDKPVAPVKVVTLRGKSEVPQVKAKDPDDCPCTGRDLFTVGHRCGREKRKR